MQDEKDGNRARFFHAYPNTKSPLSRDLSRFSLFGCFASIAPTGADSISSTGSSSVGSDRAVLDEGWISLTPLLMDVTSYETFDQIPPLEFSSAKQV